MGSTGPSTMRFTACALLGPVATSTMRRACMMEAMPMVSACVGTCSPSAKKRPVVAARLLAQAHAVAVRREVRRGLVEPDVPVGAQAQQLQVQPARGGDGRVVGAALGVRVLRKAVGDVDLLRAPSAGARRGSPA